MGKALAVIAAPLRSCFDVLSEKVKSEEGHEQCGILGFLWHFVFVQDLKILYFSLLRANKNVCKQRKCLWSSQIWSVQQVWG